MREDRYKKDKKLIAKIKKNKDAFSILYERFYKRIHNYIRSRLNNKSYAEDLTQEIFEKVLNAIDDFKWQGVTLSSWIFRITRNHLTDYYRKNKKSNGRVSLYKVERYIDDKSRTIDDEIELEEVSLAIFKALRNFSEENQYLIYYKFFENLKNTEIADITGMSETNVGTRLYRLRAKLEKLLDNFS